MLVDSHTISRQIFRDVHTDCTELHHHWGTTAGVIANVVEFTMPDGSKIPYTGYQAFYPDGTVVYGKCLKINIPAEQKALE